MQPNRSWRQGVGTEKQIGELRPDVAMVIPGERVACR